MHCVTSRTWLVPPARSRTAADRTTRRSRYRVTGSRPRGVHQSGPEADPGTEVWLYGNAGKRGAGRCTEGQGGVGALRHRAVGQRRVGRHEPEIPRRPRRRRAVRVRHHARVARRPDPRAVDVARRRVARVNRVLAGERRGGSRAASRTIRIRSANGAGVTWAGSSSTSWRELASSGGRCGGRLGAGLSGFRREGLLTGPRCRSRRDRCVLVARACSCPATGPSRRSMHDARAAGAAAASPSRAPR